MVSPLAKGLFHRAIIENGPVFSNNRYLKAGYRGEPSAEGVDEQFASAMGAQSLAELRQKPAQEVVDAWTRAGKWLAIEFVVDGWSIPEQIYTLFTQGKQHNIPVMIGYTNNEASYLSLFVLMPSVSEKKGAYIKEIARQFGDLVDDYLAVYSQVAASNSLTNNMEDAVFAAVRDHMYGWPAQACARQSGQLSSNAYLFVFSHEPPDAEQTVPFQGGYPARRKGAYHGAAMPYILNDIQSNSDSLNQSVKQCETELKFADVVSDYVITFAATGKPCVKGLPKWKPFSAKSQHFILSSADGAVPSNKPYPGSWSLFENIKAQQKQTDVFHLWPLPQYR